MNKLIIILLLSYVFQGYSQDYFEDVKKISNRFSSDYLSIDAVATTYDLYGKENYSTEAVLRKSKLKSYTKHLNTEVLEDGKETIIIDHETKEITLFTEIKNQKQASFDFEAQLSNLKKNIDTIIFLGDKDGKRTYEIETKDELISSVQMEFNYKNYALTKIIYTYNQVKGVSLETSYSTIHYTHFSTNPISDKFFYKKKYLLKSKGAYVPSPSFSHYKLEVI
jgi:hypothetical protein